jgi:hypothetical protein
MWAQAMMDESEDRVPLSDLVHYPAPHALSVESVWWIDSLIRKPADRPLRPGVVRKGGEDKNDPTSCSAPRNTHSRNFITAIYHALRFAVLLFER